MIKELLPCPFCEDQVICKYEGRKEGLTDGDALIECETCSLELREDCNKYGFEGAALRVIKRWNTRAAVQTNNKTLYKMEYPITDKSDYSCLGNAAKKEKFESPAVQVHLNARKEKPQILANIIKQDYGAFLAVTGAHYGLTADEPYDFIREIAEHYNLSQVPKPDPNLWRMM